MKRILTCLTGAALALTLTAGPAAADPARDEAAFEQALLELATAESPAEARILLERTVGRDAAAQIAEESGARTVEDSRADESSSPSGAGALTAKKRSFTQCMRARVESDLKSIFTVNAFAALIGEKKYLAAARAAVTYLAEQGIKRNAFRLAAVLANYAGRCAAEG